jgi:hypothetical protein
MSDAPLQFPYATSLVAPLRTASERAGSLDYLQMWAVQAAALGKRAPANRFTRELTAEVLRAIGK